MSGGALAISIIAIVAFTILRIVKYNTGRSYRTHLEHPVDDAERVALKREVEDLRERIKVLEKITVDDRSTKQIADEIERLRDK